MSDAIHERHGSNVVTYYITNETSKYPTFEWILGQVDSEEDKISIFRLGTHSLNITKVDFNKYWVILTLVQFHTERYIGEYSCYAPNHLILTRYDGEIKTLADIETIFCDKESDLNFAFSKFSI